MIKHILSFAGLAAVAPPAPAQSGSHDWVAWSGWVFGLISVLWIVAAEARLASERRRVRRVAGQLEPSVPSENQATSIGVDLRPNRHHPPDDRLRSVLIQLAVDSVPFSMAVQRAKRFGFERKAVEAASLFLRD